MYISEQKESKWTVWKEDEWDVNRNRKLFWKEVSNMKGGKVESCNIIKDGNRRLVQGKYEV